MARIIAIILSMTLIVGACVVAIGSTFFGWDIFGEQTDEHTHQYSEEITKAPTCTEEGVKTFTCSGEGCDKPTYTEPIEKIPHTEVKLDGKAATCTEDGLTEGKKCSACGETTVKQETIPATGHKEETLAAVAPTCTETGLTEGKKCSKCDTVLEAQNTKPATGHKYDDNYDATCNNEGCDFVRDADCRHSNTEVLAAKAATCTETGLTEGLKCKDCEDILTKQEVVAMLAHSWTAATCTAPKTCSACKATEGEALDHHWKPATCTDPKTCQRENCGVTEGDALGHNWKDATCTEPQICSVCTATQGEKLGHKWNDATCDTPKTCSVCKVTEGSKLDHDYADATYAWSADNKTCTATKVCKNDASHVVTESGKVTAQTVSATCVTVGTVTYTATFTEDGFVKQTKSENVDKLPHSYGTTSYDWSDDYKSCTAVKNCTGTKCYSNISETVISTTVTVASTCTVKGSVTYTADFKNTEFEDQTHVEELPLASHNLVTNSKPATCTETGLTEILKCTNCSYTEGTQEVIPVQPHTYDDSEGYATECSVCHTPRPACKHEDRETIKGYAATCEKEGLTDGERCKTCGETVVGQTTIAKAAHTPGAAATCTEDQICTVCEVTLNNATGHSFGNVRYEWITSNGEVVACKATRTCQNGCGTNENETVNAESKIVSEAACEEAGTKTYTAVFSNSAFKTQTKDVEIPALEHSYTYVVTEPTCTAGGYTTYTCSKCRDSYTDDETTKLDHEFKNYVSDNNATCTEDGTKTAKCERCDETDTVADVGSAKGHSFNNYVSNNDATCTADGTETAKCDNCDATDKRVDEGSQLAHNYKSIAENEYLKSAATCTANAVYYKSCSICGASSKDSETPVTFEGEKLAHTPGTAVEENRVESSCTVAGSYDEVVYCSVCKTHEISRTEKALALADHTPGTAVEENKVESSCTVAGSYDEVVYCSVCKTHEISRTEKALALADHTPGTAATCTTAQTCTKCDYIFVEVLDHDWADATCTTPKTCKRDNCGVTEGNALDHSMTDGKCDRCPVATIEKALTLEDGTAVILTGYVKSIDYAWSDANGNMSVTLRDETGDHTIYIFKLATKVSLGDYITVTGEKLNYNGTHEVVNGSALIITAHTECTPAADATCTDPSVCSICGALVAPALGHINDDTDDECDRCHTYVTVSTVWTLVTDVNELSAGDKIIIVSNDESYAMGGQNTNNRAAVAVTKNGSIVTFVTDVEVITLEATDTDGMFAFKVDEGYLYAASSSSNHLKTKSTLDVNGEWNVTIASGIATIKATNSDNRNWLRFNTSNSPKIFSCYSSGQKDVAIYKQSTAVVEAWGVTFDYNDDVTEDRVAVVADGSLVSKPTDPEMDGYNFAGWFTEAGAEFDFSAAVTESVTLVAKWEAKVYYDVIFNTDGGSSVATQRIETGYTATEPTTPTKDNHTFDGWYTDAECNTKFDFSTPITTNTTIYAKWISNELPKYNVTFETGDGSDVETQVITQGEKVSKPADPTLSNHAFGGWYTDEGCTEAYDFETKVTSAFTLYAKWIETVDFTITFDDTSKRTEFSTTAQVWEENGITVSNIKNTSTSNVADYCNPVRFYKNSKVTVQFENMTKIVFVCDSSSFASALQTSIGTVNGVTVEVSGSNVIVTFDTPVNAYSVVLSGGQVQVKSITVTAYAPCEHQSETGVEPVCGNTATCKLCGMVYTGAHSPITVEAVAATCITSGTTAGTKCNLCEITISGIETVGATGNHIYGDDGICTTPNCGEKKPSIPSTSEPVTVDVNFSELYSGNANLNGVEHKLDDVVSVTFAKNSGTTNPQYYTNGTAARLYGKNSVTISCAEGYKITSVIITTTSSNAITSSNCGSTDATMSISGTEVTLIPNAEGTTSIVLTNPNTSGNARIAAIEVTYEKIS